jgi:hypothetical protein
MTSLSLLLWIAGGIFLQVATYLAIVFWRHWLEYQSLQGRAAALDLPATVAAPVEDEAPAVAAWQGYRTFRVVRRVVEDVAHSICSFHLVPEDGKALPGFLPGQFLTFRLDILTATGGTEQIIRCYSLSDAPTRRRLPRVDQAGTGIARAVRTHRGDPRTTSTTTSRSAACCRFARRPGISISTAAMPRWC